jgi:fluoroacetyl-CoA thioesterase
MKNPPPIGLSADKTYLVEPQHLIDFTDGGMPAVLSTPALIGFLERTAREALIPRLDPGENSVGVEIEIRHLAPTPPGQRITCVARVIHTEGTQITFQLEARDETELIARGLHTRRVVHVDRFAQAVSRKQKKSP